MNYKLDLSELDIDLIYRIKTSLEGNPESLDLFEGLGFDSEYDDYEMEDFDI